MINHRKWHEGFGPFFHYFAHPWYPHCKAARGKDELVADIQGTVGEW